MKAEVVRSSEEIQNMIGAIQKAIGDEQWGHGDETKLEQMENDLFELELYRDDEIVPFDDESEVRRWLLGHRGQLLEATYLG